MGRPRRPPPDVRGPRRRGEGGRAALFNAQARARRRRRCRQRRRRAASAAFVVDDGHAREWEGEVRRVHEVRDAPPETGAAAVAARGVDAELVAKVGRGREHARHQILAAPHVPHARRRQPAAVLHVVLDAVGQRREGQELRLERDGLVGVAGLVGAVVGAVVIDGGVDGHDARRRRLDRRMRRAPSLPALLGRVLHAPADLHRVEQQRHTSRGADAFGGGATAVRDIHECRERRRAAQQRRRAAGGRGVVGRGVGGSQLFDFGEGFGDLPDHRRRQTRRLARDEAHVLGAGAAGGAGGF
mmetsp:Transcript_23413/g.81209  ORF Transcript_23413/g.81209 Transcript_23413/m.81209 type:complete len:300 (+) Transcript_23413:347-1246(+)